MNWYQRQRAIVTSTIVRDTPRAFWEEFRIGTRRIYADVFEQVRNDKGLLVEQRMDMSCQLRHFRMEYLLSSIAHQHGWACTPTMLVENNRHYVYAATGAIGLTQAYVPAIGALPHPARFRERHAAINAILRSPRLDLGDEPPEVMLGKDYYGIITHNPVGKRFIEAEQHLGMIQVCWPTGDMSEWAVELTIEEIVSSYAAEAPKADSDRRLPWKRRDKKVNKEE